MRVKIGDTIYDPDEAPIAIYLEDSEREQIAGMIPPYKIYSQYPIHIEADEMQEWLNKFRKEVEG